MKRPGRSRKNVKSGNILPANFESKDCVDGCEWKAVVKPTGLKIVLHKIDSRNSALVCKQNGISPKKQDFKFLFPKLTLPKIDSFIAEEKFSVFSVNSDEDGRSFRQFFSSYSKSVINSPELPRSLITERIFSMNSLLEDKSYPQRRSRKVLKDVKNTSVDREVRKNVFHGFEQSNIGQENVPITSNFDPRPVTCPQISIRLPQLNENLYRRTVIEKKYVESSTFSSNQESIESRFQSFVIRGINNEGLEKSSSEMIVRNFTQTRNEVEAPTQSKLVEISSLETAPKAKRGRKRKSRKGKYAQKDDRDEHQNKASRRKKTRSSSFVSRQEAAEDALQFFRSSSKQKDQCKAIPSPEILQNTFKHRMQKDNIVGTKIIRKEAALEIHSTTFEDREKDDLDPLESPSRLQQTEVRLNISTKTVRENNTELDEFLELRYSAIEETKSEPTSFNSRKRKWSETEYNSKKRPFDHYNGPASNDSNRCVVLLPRIELPQLAIEAPKNTKTRIRQLIPKADSAPFSYVTRNKAAAYEEPVQFIRIPWNKSKGVEILNTKPKVKEHRFQTKSEPKPNVEVKKKSSKRQPVNSYSCYRTRQKSAQSGEHVEFYQIPWKKMKGSETVQTNKSKKPSKKTAKKEDISQFLDDLPLKRRLELLQNKSKKVNISQFFDVDNDVPFKGFEDEFSTTVVAPEIEATIKKKGILKRNETLASSTPFPESSRRKAIPSNVSFFDDVEAATENDTLSPVKDHHDVDTINRVPNGFTMRSCSVVLNCMPNPMPSSPSKSKRLMTGSEARRRAESFNCSKKALEMKTKSNRSGSDYLSDTSVKRSTRMRNKRINYCYSSQTSGSSSEEEPQIVVNRSKMTTPYVRLRKLNSADITSYKITPLKEDRIPKKSKTADDYGIDDINTDDSTDDEEFPKKFIPQWAKDYKNQPPCQSYLDMDMLDDWMRPPKFKYSLRHVFFSIKSHTFT